MGCLLLHCKLDGNHPKPALKQSIKSSNGHRSIIQEKRGCSMRQAERPSHRFADMLQILLFSSSADTILHTRAQFSSYWTPALKDDQPDSSLALMEKVGTRTAAAELPKASTLDSELSELKMFKIFQIKELLNTPYEFEINSYSQSPATQGSEAG